MSNVLEDSLFVSQNKKFDEIQSIVRQFSAEYVGNSIIKDNIFAVIQNYARKKEIALELLRYPIHDDELWALTFLKQDTIFVCVNTALPLCKQFFAAAHELYHIYCYVENADQSYIKNGSMLDSATGDETGRTQEDLEANAFAGLLLMPDQLLHEQILLYGLDKDLVTVDSVLMLMDMFAMPYKAVVLRLFESGNISHQQAEKLLEVGSADVMERVSLTGKAKRWQLDGKGTESFGTLLEKVEYNRQHEYLTESRENEDVAYAMERERREEEKMYSAIQQGAGRKAIEAVRADSSMQMKTILAELNMEQFRRVPLYECYMADEITEEQYHAEVLDYEEAHRKLNEQLTAIMENEGGRIVVQFKYEQSIQDAVRALHTD